LQKHLQRKVGLDDTTPGIPVPEHERASADAAAQIQRLRGCSSQQIESFLHARTDFACKEVRVAVPDSTTLETPTHRLLVEAG
jgi:hypothetical protein